MAQRLNTANAFVLLLSANLYLPVDTIPSPGVQSLIVQLMQVSAIKMIIVAAACGGVVPSLRAALTLATRRRGAKKRQEAEVVSCRLASKC